MASAMGAMDNVTSTSFATMLATLNKGILNVFKPDEGPVVAIFAFKGVFMSAMRTRVSST